MARIQVTIARRGPETELDYSHSISLEDHRSVIMNLGTGEPVQAGDRASLWAFIYLLGGEKMSDIPMQAFWVGRGVDRLGEQLGRGIGHVFFKVSTEDSRGRLLVVEMTHHAKGGPGRHFHYEQDEWFYVVEGEYVFEVGQERVRLKPGDSAFGPRKIPHVWTFASDAPGRILFIFTPAGQMEAFFREPGKADARPPQDPAYFRAYGMELVGPPLAIE